MSSVLIEQKTIRLPWSALLLYLLVVLISFNYAHLLFTGKTVDADPWYLKVVKDVPIVLILLIMFARGMTVGKLAFPDSAITTSFLYLGLFLTIRGLDSDIHLVDRLLLFRYLVVYPFLMFAAIPVLNSYKRIERTARLAQFFAVIVALIGIADFFFEFSRSTFLSALIFLFGQRLSRTISTLGNPSNLGDYLGIVLMGTLAVSYCGFYTKKWVYWALTFTYFFCMCLTFSRGSVLAFAMSYIWLRVAVKRVDLFSILSFAFLLVMSMVVFSGGIREMDTVRSAIMQSRVKHWMITIETIANSPKALAIGYGLGSQSSYGNRLEPSEELGWISGTNENVSDLLGLVTDNMYLGMLLDTGVIGLALFVLLLSCVVATGLRVHRRHSNPEVRAIGLTCAAVMMFMIVHSFFANIFMVFPASVVIWLLVGCLFSVMKLESGNGSLSLPVREPSVL